MTDSFPNLYAEARARSLSPKDEFITKKIIDTLPNAFWFENQIDIIRQYKEKYKDELEYLTRHLRINNYVIQQHKLDNIFFYFDKNIILFTTFNDNNTIQSLPTELVDFLGVTHYRKTLNPVNDSQILHNFSLDYSLKCMTSITSTMNYAQRDIRCDNRNAIWRLPENGGVILRLYIKEGVKGLLYSKFCDYDADIILLEPNLHYSVTNFSCASFWNKEDVKKEYIFIDACVEHKR